MKHFLVEITYTRPFEEIAPVVSQHRAFLQQGYDCGWLLMSGPMHPRTGGIVIARAENEEQLRDYFARDPYALNQMAIYRFVEFDPVKYQPFLEMWITKS
ncbi:YciI family protein [uncultured Thermanaerothrix sp.]|uniref:YciI family protein n=1 Tax=uncultured Thermanaerothrix sp. TaxID=1195149 RepID=UPI0026357F02|nr:YciI family protein [uncultured Thermanaerothrix sp.]